MTGSILIDSLIAGDMEIFWSGFMHLIMPVFTLAFVYGAPIFKMLRSQMEGALKADYTTYAEAVGLAPRIVLTRAARVAAGPTLVITGVVVMFLLGGAVLVERVFNYVGLGQYAINGIVTADYAPIQGFVCFAAIFTMLVYLAVDLIHFAMDPRIKIGGTQGVGAAGDGLAPHHAHAPGAAEVAARRAGHVLRVDLPHHLRPLSRALPHRGRRAHHPPAAAQRHVPLRHR